MENTDKALLAAALNSLEQQSKAMERQGRMVIVVSIVSLLMVMTVVIGGVVAHNITLDKILNADITTEKTVTTTTNTHEIKADDGSNIIGSNINIGGIK